MFGISKKANSSPKGNAFDDLNTLTRKNPKKQVIEESIGTVSEPSLDNTQRKVQDIINSPQVILPKNRLIGEVVSGLDGTDPFLKAVASLSSSQLVIPVVKNVILNKIHTRLLNSNLKEEDLELPKDLMDFSALESMVEKNIPINNSTRSTNNMNKYQDLDAISIRSKPLQNKIQFVE